MHSTSRPAAAGRSSGASKETPNGCWKKMAPLHQLEANTFMPGSPSPGSDLSEFFEEFEDRSLICWCGSSKNSFWTTSEWWKLYVMSTFQRYEALETSICARCCQGGQHGRSSPWKCRQSWTENTATADLVMLRKEPNKTILPSNHGRKQTHTHTHLFTTAFGLVKHLFMGL
jgi:hypothetical protein